MGYGRREWYAVSGEQAAVLGSKVEGGGSREQAVGSSYWVVDTR
jgi:hypothetical protein